MSRFLISFRTPSRETHLNIISYPCFLICFVLFTSRWLANPDHQCFWYLFHSFEFCCGSMFWNNCYSIHTRIIKSFSDFPIISNNFALVITGYLSYEMFSFSVNWIKVIFDWVCSFSKGFTSSQKFHYHLHSVYEDY